MYFCYIILGILIGFASGMFGIGGSLVTTPILSMLSVPDLIAIASPLPVTIPTAISGVIAYQKKKMIRRKVALYSIISGLPATIIGAWATKFVNSKILLFLTGIFLIITGIRLIKKEKSLLVRCLKVIPEPILTAIIGIVAGFLSGFLAIGGGLVLVPAFILMLGLTMQESAATSLLCVAFFAVPGTIVHWKLGHINWMLVISLSLGVIPAGFLGAKLALKISSIQLRTAFSIFLILFGIYFTFKQFYAF